jgi:hypothetical protein
MELVLLCVFSLHQVVVRASTHNTWQSSLNNFHRWTRSTPSVALVQPLELGHIAVSMVFLLHGVHLVWLWTLAHRARVVLFCLRDYVFVEEKRERRQDMCSVSVPFGKEERKWCIWEKERMQVIKVASMTCRAWRHGRACRRKERARHMAFPAWFWL